MQKEEIADSCSLQKQDVLTCYGCEHKNGLDIENLTVTFDDIILATCPVLFVLTFNL